MNEADYKEWEKWEKSTEFVADNQTDQRINDPDVILPDEGFIFNKICSNKQSLIDFIKKFESLEEWEESEIIELKEKWEEYEAIEVKEELSSTEEKQFKLFHYNNMFPDGKRCQLKKLEYNVDNREFELIDEYKYPVLVHYCVQATYDRAGNSKMRYIMIFELGNMEPDKIQLV